jgi:hypothetical protein
MIRALDAAGLLDNDSGNGGEMGVFHARRAAPRGRLMPLRTPLEAAAASVENEPALRQLKATLRRSPYHFDLKDNELVDLVALDKALMASDNIPERMSVRMNLARLALIP